MVRGKLCALRPLGPLLSELKLRFRLHTESFSIRTGVGAARRSCDGSAASCHSGPGRSQAGSSTLKPSQDRPGVGQGPMHNVLDLQPATAAHTRVMVRTSARSPGC